MVIPTHSPIPTLYELTLIDETTLGLRVHKIALSKLQELDWAKISLNFASAFTAPIAGDCGLNNVFVLGQSDHPDWIVWQFTLPQAEVNDAKAFAIRATFNLFVDYLSMCYEVDTGWSTNQLIFIQDFSTSASGSFRAIFTPTVVKWLSSSKNREKLEEITKAMRTAFSHIWRSRFEGLGFQATCEDGYRFHLLPGDRAGLDPAPNTENLAGHGYELICHNIDTWMVQLSLLIGLAKLHDLIRAT